MAQLELQDIERRLDAIREVVQDASRFNDDFEPKRVREELARAERMLGDLVADISEAEFDMQNPPVEDINLAFDGREWAIEPELEPVKKPRKAAKKAKKKRR